MASRNEYDSVPILPVRVAARLLGIHVNTVRRWSDRGILRAYRIGPRGDRRFSREDIVAIRQKRQ